MFFKYLFISNLVNLVELLLILIIPKNLKTFNNLYTHAILNTMFF